MNILKQTHLFDKLGLVEGLCVLLPSLTNIGTPFFIGISKTSKGFSIIFDTNLRDIGETYTEHSGAFFVVDNMQSMLNALLRYVFKLSWKKWPDDTLWFKFGTDNLKWEFRFYIDVPKGFSNKLLPNAISTQQIIK